MAGFSLSTKMNASLPQLKNFAPVDRNRALILEIIKDKEEALYLLQQKIYKGRIRHDAAIAGVDRARECLALAEATGRITKEGYDSVIRAFNDMLGSLRAQSALLHPIRRLPPEILHEIFKHCLTYHSHGKNMITSTRIAAVCRAWRLAACSLQSLWNELYLDASDER